jgi:exopolyphosphatase/pppGpp-phosphohydrolase
LLIDVHIGEKMRKIIIDIGSSTVKVYGFSACEELNLLETKSFSFKEGFDPKVGITEKNKRSLFDYVNKITSKYINVPLKVYATALFRKCTVSVQRSLSDEFFRKTGQLFNIISHELEGHYLEKALAGSYNLNEPLLLINIGGGSTELVVIENGFVKERYNLDLGVMTVLKDFPRLNDPIAFHKLDEIVESICNSMPAINCKTPYAIYNGGELTYMRLVGYKLKKNDIFKDNKHPNQISLEDFSAKNQDVFCSITLKQLEDLMPNDPLWMHGARACSAIAQAVASHFGVSQIVPSDSNMAHGILHQEFRSVVLSGSFRKHLDYILSVKKQLHAKKIQVLSPRFDEPKNAGQEFVIFEGEEGLSPLELERHHLDMIELCDALVVCASNGYVGASTLIEIGYAQALGKRIIFTEKPTEFMLQTLPAEIGLSV